MAARRGSNRLEVEDCSVLDSFANYQPKYDANGDISRSIISLGISKFPRHSQNKPSAASVVLQIQFHDIIGLLGLFEQLQESLQVFSGGRFQNFLNITNLRVLDGLEALVKSSVGCESDYRRFFCLAHPVYPMTGLLFGCIIEEMIVEDEVSEISLVDIAIVKWRDLTLRPLSSDRFLRPLWWPA